MGKYEIPARVPKESADVIYFPLYCIFRQSVVQCKLPEIWKIAIKKRISYVEGKHGEKNL